MPNGFREWAPLWAFGLYSAGLGAASLVTYFTIRLARRINFVSHPNPIVQNHVRPIPLGGGIGIGLLQAGACLVFAQAGLIPHRIGWGLLPILALGTADDLWKLRPLPKFLLQCAASIPYALLAPLPGWSWIPVTVLLVASQNAWNFIDIMDGLMGSVAMLAFLGMAGLYIITQAFYPGGALIALTTAGIIGGFLLWNAPPARIYLGDAGSLVLGALFGFMVVETWLAAPILAPVVGLYGLIPFFEMGFLIIERTAKGIPFYRGTPDHFALRMLHHGYTVPGIIWRTSAVGLILVLLGWLVARQGADTSIGIAAAAIALLMAAAAFRYFHRLPSRELRREA
jgi:UDP-GlcNAc:undecaprenyl-phosphate GlcNAc-1-phosphate transferase